MLVVKIASNHKMPPADCISFFKAIAKRTSKNQEACRENRKFSITLHARTICRSKSMTVIGLANGVERRLPKILQQSRHKFKIFYYGKNLDSEIKKRHVTLSWSY